jgi:hypothetical protein
MSARLSYRIAAVVLLLFAVGHTIGFLSFRPSSTEGLAVLESMRSVLFDFNGRSSSYGQFYNGFGLIVTAYLLFSSFLAWHLGSVARTQPQTIGMLAWAFVAVQLACLILNLLYFFLVPVLFSAVVVVCSAWAAWLLRRPWPNPSIERAG